jgi:hypothetical protein
MSLWGSDIFGASRERNKNEEWIRKQSISKQGQRESPNDLTGKEQKTINIWVQIGFLIVLVIFVIWYFLL